jgi:transcriptional regulator with XRE-family HTH domain
MDFNSILEQKNITKYRLSKISGVPFATISEISSGKTRLRKCNAETLYKLAKALDMTMEDLIADSMEHRQSFETFKSNICHMVKDKGDVDFIIDTLESDEISRLYQKQWFPESLYLLAMVDYLSRENAIPLCTRYDDLRTARLRETLFPSGIMVMCAASRSERPKQDSIRQAIPEFMRFNIVESEVRNVW